MILYYFHDPMCSWCYAFSRSLKQLEKILPDTICLTKIVSGLAADSMTPMSIDLQNMIQENWKRIETVTPHIQFNYLFWSKNQAIRSTYPSCRAVLAAKKQDIAYEDIMIEQIQQAYYQNAENPSLDNILLLCAQRTGLNMADFSRDYAGEIINKQLQSEILFTQKCGISSYPSLLLKIDDKLLPIQVDYNNAQNILKQIHQFI